MKKQTKNKEVIQTDSEFMLFLGRRIRMARIARGLSLYDLSALCNMDKASLSRIETGKGNPTAITLYLLSKALNTSVLFFMC